MEKKVTVGQMALEMALKEPDTYDSWELSQEQLKTFPAEIQKAYHAGRAKYPPNKDFYIQILIKWERIFGEKVIHPHFLPRQSCPTPEWDQVVYRCHHESGEVEFLWVLPNRKHYYYLLYNPFEIHQDEQQMLKFVQMDHSGELLRWAKRLNGEIVTGKEEI